VNPELPATRAAKQPQTVAAQDPPSSPVEPRRVDPPTANAHQRTGTATNVATPSQQAHHRNKAARKSRVARDRNRDGDYRDHWGYQDYDYRAYRDYNRRERRRTAGAWRDDAAWSDFFSSRPLSRQRPYSYSN